MRKLFGIVLLGALVMFNPVPCFAGTHGTNSGISPRSVGAAACSLFLWPGVGQVVNDQNKEKCVTHAVLGLTGIFRIWSCYDALVDREGGVWGHRI